MLSLAIFEPFIARFKAHARLIPTAKTTKDFDTISLYAFCEPSCPFPFSFATIFIDSTLLTSFRSARSLGCSSF